VPTPQQQAILRQQQQQQMMRQQNPRSAPSPRGSSGLRSAGQDPEKGEGNGR
jgi:hypothetical protein